MALVIQSALLAGLVASTGAWPQGNSASFLMREQHAGRHHESLQHGHEQDREIIKVADTPPSKLDNIDSSKFAEFFANHYEDFLLLVEFQEMSEGSCSFLMREQHAGRHHESLQHGHEQDREVIKVDDTTPIKLDNIDWPKFADFFANHYEDFLLLEAFEEMSKEEQRELANDLGKDGIGPEKLMRYIGYAHPLKRVARAMATQKEEVAGGPQNQADITGSTEEEEEEEKEKRLVNSRGSGSRPKRLPLGSTLVSFLALARMLTPAGALSPTMMAPQGATRSHGSAALAAAKAPAVGAVLEPVHAPGAYQKAMDVKWVESTLGGIENAMKTKLESGKFKQNQGKGILVPEMGGNVGHSDMGRASAANAHIQMFGGVINDAELRTMSDADLKAFAQEQGVNVGPRATVAARNLLGGHGIEEIANDEALGEHFFGRLN